MVSLHQLVLSSPQFTARSTNAAAAFHTFIKDKDWEKPYLYYMSNAFYYSERFPSRHKLAWI